MAAKYIHVIYSLKPCVIPYSRINQWKVKSSVCKLHDQSMHMPHRRDLAFVTLVYLQENGIVSRISLLYLLFNWRKCECSLNFVSHMSHTVVSGFSTTCLKQVYQLNQETNRHSNTCDRRIQFLCKVNISIFKELRNERIKPVVVLLSVNKRFGVHGRRTSDC